MSPCHLYLHFMLLSASALHANTWTDPEKAAAEHPDFLLQGEYVGEHNGAKTGLQAASLNNGRFLVAAYQGGLPGDGWDRSKVESSVLEREALENRVKGLKRVERESMTLGRKPPLGAVVIFDGEKTDKIEGRVENGLLWPPAKTTDTFGDFQMHLEFRMPFKPSVNPSSQDRGNSGIYIFDRYECQILDTFALDFDRDNNPVNLESDSNQWGACLYKFKEADINMCYPPLQWQTYDIKFTAPVFVDDKKSANARITLWHNGVKVHDDVELPKGTGLGGTRAEIAEGFIHFQDHANPVAFRNVWILPN